MTLSDPEFAARLERIRSRRGQSTILVGQDDQHHIPRKATHRPSRGREIARNMLYPGSLLGAFCLGMIGVFAGRYVQFQVLSGVAELQDPMSELIFGAVFGLTASFVLSQVFKLTSKEHRGLQSLGVVLMACMFHNLAHWAPTAMSLAFSPDWVAETVASTPRSSFGFGSGYYPLFPEAATAQADPVPTCIATAPAASVPQTILQAVPKVLVLTGKQKSTGRKVVHPEAPAAAEPVNVMNTTGCP